MASTKTVSAANLLSLGSERLADILFDLAEEDADIKRRLRLELAERAGGDDLAAEIGKRLTSLQSGSTFIDWQRRNAFARDLDLQREMIAERLATTRPDLALDLMWRFLALAGPIYNRSDDNGIISDVFREAREDLGKIAVAAKPDQSLLADKVFYAISINDYSQYDGLVPVIFEALGEGGASSLKAKLYNALANRPKVKEGEYDYQARALARALQDIADAEGDVDAYIALSEGQQAPKIAAGIAQRLLSAGRAEEALVVLRNSAPNDKNRTDDFWLNGFYADADWDDAYIDALDATGQTEEAQSTRWARFERHLSISRLRGYLKLLKDFDDVIAEEKAMEHALAFPNATTALAFFVEWPNPASAAKLVIARDAEINGGAYYLLDPAARLLEGSHPLAATLLRRAMIHDTLDGARSKRYRHAARHLAECTALNGSIPDYGDFESHDAFLASIQATHRRKSGFWACVQEFEGKKV